jgi:hypothetical protein
LAARNLEFESKAMRKFKSTDVMIGVLEAQVETGTVSINFTAESRILVKLS